MPMQVTIKGKNTEVGSKLRERAEEKLAKVERLGSNILAMDVEFSKERNPRVPDAHRVEVTCQAGAHLIRAQASGPDPVTAVDGVLGRLERQIKKLKGRQHHRSHHGESRPVDLAAAEQREAPAVPDLSSEYEARIIRNKDVIVTPMTAGEAAMKMDLLGFDFYLFIEIATNQPAVVYRRRDDDFGLIKPEV
jgi:putative sigma-54 modulation protein